nr:FecR domain-containing protein [uncultured Albidiferax sp.]
MNPVTERVAHEAAQWFFRLQSEEASAADHARWADWHAADATHALAWQRAEHIQQQFSRLPPALALPVLNRRRSDRRMAAKTLAALLVAAPAGWLAWRATPAREWLADHRTATGERRALVLADGSRLLLDTASAVDVKFDSYQRKVYLRQGAILLITSPDPQNRPLVVETPQGRVRGLGTRFTVRVDGVHSQVAVQQSAVEIRPHATQDATVVLQAGQQAAFTASAVGPVEAAGPHADGWTRGVLVAQNMRLHDFAAALGRYRPGLLHCDPAVVELRISGVFQLRDTTPVLDSLPQALAVQVRYRTRYWVTLEAPGG